MTRQPVGAEPSRPRTDVDADGPVAAHRPEPGGYAIIDERACIREALVAALTRLAPTRDIVGLSGVEQCLRRRRLVARHIVVLAVTRGLKRAELVAGVSSLMDSIDGAKVVLLVDDLDESVLELCVHCPIDGVVPSAYSTVQLLACLDAIGRGAHLVPLECLAPLRATEWRARAGTEAVRTLDARLTPRQHEVMTLVAQGRSNKYIAAELALAESTVKVHVSELMRRLGARSRTHASFLMHRFSPDRRPEPRTSVAGEAIGTDLA